MAEIMTDENKLTVVVGAGASKEFGLPTGAELKASIASLLNLKFDDFDRQNSGDYLICEALRLVAAERSGQRTIHPFIGSIKHIRGAMPQALSIDNFIDTHQGNDGIEICGKLAISRAILKSERASSLYVDSSNHKSTLNFTRTEDAWLSPLLKIVTENCRSNELEQRLSGLSFIVFNYDRCIEHYLYYWLKNYYNLSHTAAASLVSGIKIYHPYGTVGLLPWQSRNEDAVPFGSEPSEHQLLSIARQIKTFTEGTDPDSSDISQIKRLMLSSEIIVFLGFAYHRLNLQLLSSPPTIRTIETSKQMFGTAAGISPHNTELIKTALVQSYSVQREHIHIRNDLLCSGLIDAYSRSLHLH